MPSLHDFIHVIPSDKDEEVEDIFAAAPGLIFPDDFRNTHGDPGSVIVYKSPRFGDIELRTADPEGETERQLFSHYLWNAGIHLANLVSDKDSAQWTVEGERVLELGAGVGLVGIVAILAGADEVVLSDYPAPVVLDNLRRNADGAIAVSLRHRYQIVSHEWGETTDAFAEKHQHYFSRIVIADCLWMPSQHLNLVRSILHFLSHESGARAFVVAGFHTGRARTASFFDVAVEEGLQIEQMYEEDVDGVRREWMRERDGGKENVTERKRWLLVARLKR